MRELFFKQLHELMSKNWNVYFVTGDLGFGLADKIKKDFPDRFINSGAAECAMTGLSIGLALEGKTVFCYSITPFLLFRPFEAIRNYLHHEGVPVILVGSGRGKDYEHDGHTHYAGDDYLIDPFFTIKKYTSYNSLQEIIDDKRPAYISLKR
jgi:transketolase